MLARGDVGYEVQVADPLFTIVVRTKNRPTLLARALDDVLAQTEQSWFLVIVNDGGDPRPVDALVAERSEQFGHRVSVLHNALSSGMEAASNQGILHNASEFVAIHDDDDTWHPQFLERTGSWLAAHAEASAVAVRTEIVWETITPQGIRTDDTEVFLPALTQVTLFDLLRFNVCVPISMLYRREALVAVGLFSEKLPVAGDWECHVRLATHADIGFLGDEVLAYWHQRPKAAGDEGNSVVALGAEHRRFDRLIRSESLRAYVQADGAGLPLYLTRFMDDRFDEMAARLDRIEAAAGDTFYRRLKSAIRGLVRSSRR